MESRLRKLIRGLIAEALDEARRSIHVDVRFDERIKPELIVVGVQTGYKTFLDVGEYSIPEEVKDDILLKTRKCEKWQFKEELELFVRLATINIQPEDVDFYPEYEASDFIGKEFVLMGGTEKDPSDGNEVWLMIKDNTLVTLMFRSKVNRPKNATGVYDDFDKFAADISIRKTALRPRKPRP